METKIDNTTQPQHDAKLPVSGWHPLSNEYYMRKLKEAEHHIEQMKLCFDSEKAFKYHMNQCKRHLNACR